MITTATEYYQELYRIQDENFPAQAVLLPGTETIYDIDLNRRTINVPEFLSVATDHKSEVIYFKVDRYFDYMDLTNTVCVIQYVNALGDAHYYPVPFYDVTTFSKEGKILFPWVLGGSVTAAAGTVTFSIRFYRIDLSNSYFTYNLTTKPASGKVLHGMDKQEFLPENEEDIEIIANNYLTILEHIHEIKQKALDQLYWLTVEEQS